MFSIARRVCSRMSSGWTCSSGTWGCLWERGDDVAPEMKTSSAGVSTDTAGAYGIVAASSGLGCTVSILLMFPPRIGCAAIPLKLWMTGPFHRTGGQNFTDDTPEDFPGSKRSQLH